MENTNTPYSHLTIQELNYLYDQRVQFPGLPTDSFSGIGWDLLIPALMRQDAHLSAHNDQYRPLTHPTLVAQWAQHIQPTDFPTIPRPGVGVNEVLIPYDNFESPHPQGGVFQQLDQLPEPWQHLWDTVLPFQFRNARTWAHVVQAIGTNLDHNEATIFMQNLSHEGVPIDYNFLGNHHLPQPPNANPYNGPDQWPENLNPSRYPATLQNLNTRHWGRYFQRLRSYWWMKYQVFVTPAYIVASFRDAMRNRVAYEESVRL